MYNTYSDVTSKRQCTNRLRDPWEPQGPWQTKEHNNIIRTIARRSFSADSSRGFNDPNGEYPLYVDESDVNKLARVTLLDYMMALRAKRLIKPKPQSCNRN